MDKMKQRASALAVGALLTLVMIVPSFAQGNGHVKHRFRAGAAERSSNHYNAPTGSNDNDSSGDYGGLSGAIGGIGH
jgi:hypothetical protein